MQIFLWLLFILSAFTVLALILAKLPLVLNDHKVRIKTEGHHSIFNYLLAKVRILINRIWHLILEAKDLKPQSAINSQVEKVKKVFKIKIRANKTDPTWLPEVSDMAMPATNEHPVENMYLAAIRKDPLDLHSFEGLGRLYLQEKNFAEAEETYKYLIKLNPARDIYYSNLGLSQYSQSKFMEAIHSYEQALQINGKVPARWINLALCFEALEEHSKSIKAVINALSFDKANINYLSFLADIYLKVQNQVRAEEVLEQILELDPTSRQAREKLMKLRV